MGRTLDGEDHFDDWRLLDGVVIKCDGARKIGRRALRSRPQEAVPRCCTGEQQAPGLHEGAHRDVSFPCLVTLAKFAEVCRSLNEECGAHIKQQCANVERVAGRFGACLRSSWVSPEWRSGPGRSIQLCNRWL